MQLADNPKFDSLNQAADSARQYQLSALMADEARAAALQFQFEDIRLDITRQKLTTSDLSLLLDMAAAADIEAKIKAMFAGLPINATENRPVIHADLRLPARLETDSWTALAAFADMVRAGGQIKDVINLGIGGSDLGPAMVSNALAGYADGPRIHYVANVDPAHLHDALAQCAPETTLFIVTSKTFTTAETLSNALLARQWLIDAGQEPQTLMAAVTAYPERAADWGIDAGQIFSFDEGVGGRYSVWSEVGLPVMLGIGADNFAEFLAGAHDMDRHFATAPLAQNLPVIMALVRIWNRNFLDCPSYGIMAYDQHLDRLAAWAQQLEMESNGKSVDRHGAPLKLPASPLIWGEPGTNAQHSFFQYLHQGLEAGPIDILVPLSTGALGLGLDWQPSHRRLVANAIAQAEALAMGSPNQDEPHRHFAGNRQSCLISWQQTNPKTLGRLLAFYEHVTAASGFIWDINSFDQWGVELGKAMALAMETGEGLDGFSVSARALWQQI